MSAPPTDDLRQPPPDPLAGLRELLGPSARPGSLGRLGHYEVLKLLGRGGFGTVLLAHDSKLDREVAVKVLDPKHGPNSVAGVRFLREARASAPLRHENVVQIYAVEESPTPYLVMEFVPGETLHDRIERLGRLPVPDAVAVGAGVARALAAAHARGLVHRDLKPGNILVERAGGGVRAKLADFGLALSADDIRLTQNGMIVGTPLFMSPEQTRGDELDARSDLFSLGSVLYTAVGGTAPFEAKDVVAVLQRINAFDPRPLQQLNPDAPPRLCAAVHKLLAKRPEDRYQSADEAAAALAAVGRELPTHIVPATPAPPVAATEMVRVPPPAPPAGRPAWLLPAVVAAVLAVGLGGGYAAYRAARPAEVAAAGPSPAAPDATSDPTPARPVDPGPPLPKPPPTKPPGPLPEPPVRPLPPPPGTAGPLPPPPGSVAALLLSPDNEWGPPRPVGGVNTAEREITLTLTPDELEVVFLRNTALFHARRADRDAAFADPAPLPAKVNALRPIGPTLSADGLELIFSGPEGGVRHLYAARRPTRDAAFGTPERIPVDGSNWEGMPVLSADGRALLLSLHPDATGGGRGIADVGRLVRPDPAARFAGRPELLAGVNTKDQDTPSWLSPDGTALLAATTRNGVEAQRLFAGPGRDAPFDAVRPFDPFPGRLTAGRPWLTPDGRRMYFHSRDATAGRTDGDLWVSDLRPKGTK